MQLVVNIVLNSILLCLLSFSYWVIYSTSKIFHIAHAIAITLGAYFCYWMTIQFGLNLLYAIPLAIIEAVAIMVIVNERVYKPLQKKVLQNWQIVIISLGVYVVLQNCVSLFWGNSTLSFRTWEVKAGYPFLGAYVTNIQLITIIMGIILICFSWWIIMKTAMGLQIKAVSSNIELSNILGISSNKVILHSFILGSALAACAGIFIAADTDMTPTMGFNLLLYGIVAMIIGGVGSFRGLLLGSLLLATTQNVVAYYLDTKWMDAATYIILIIFLLWKPLGFSGKKLKKVEI